MTSLEYTQKVAGLPVAVAGQAFTLDAEGNRTQVVESGALGTAGASDTFSYRYDGLSRLLAADAVLFGGGTRSETFDYDEATNIQARTGPAATYTMDGANRVASDGTQSFTWDGADRLVQRGADTFSYDALSRLTSATVTGATSTYTYDGDGLLTTRTSSGGTASFLWDTSVAPAPLLKADADRIVHGLGPLYLARADGSSIRLVRDALGSVRAELNDLGIVMKAFRYAASGAISERAPLDASPTVLGFTGEKADTSGLIYLRARWYDPQSGRFLSRDPLPGELQRPQSYNGFVYAEGRPTLLRDPSGESPTSAGFRPSPWVLSCGWCVNVWTWANGGADRYTVDGVTVIQNATGVVGLVSAAFSGGGTITWGSTIVSTGRVPRGSELFAHEWGHVIQARAMGPLYLLGYLALSPGESHETHLMERHANQLARLPLDWDGRRVLDWTYPRDPRFPTADAP